MCSAYLDGSAPAFRTRSSQADSASICIRLNAIHTSGLNQYKAQAICATSLARQSQRAAWANSCSSTTRCRWGDHSSASAGNRSFDLKMPHIIGMGLCSLESRVTGRFRPSFPDVLTSNSANGPILIGRALRFSRHRLRRPSTSGVRQITTPTAHPSITQGKTLTAENLTSRSFVAGSFAAETAGVDVSVGVAVSCSATSPAIGGP